MTHSNLRRPVAQRRPGGWRASLLLWPLLGLSATHAGSSSPAQEDVESARTALEKWVETRQILSAERRDWALGRDLLESRIQLVQDEIDAARAKLAETEVSIAAAEQKQTELEFGNLELRGTTDGLRSAIAALEQRTAALLPQLPPPLLDRLQSLVQRLPEDPQATELTLAPRFLTVVGVANEVNKFNRAVHLSSEVRELGPGTSAEVRVLYFGLGQAYYVTADGRQAGVGRPGPTGYQWAQRNEIAAEVDAAIAIFQNEREAEFVRLPVHVD
jgi:hypothetical protein